MTTPTLWMNFLVHWPSELAREACLQGVGDRPRASSRQTRPNLTLRPRLLRRLAIQQRNLPRVPIAQRLRTPRQARRPPRGRLLLQATSLRLPVIRRPPRPPSRLDLVRLALRQQHLAINLPLLAIRLLPHLLNLPGPVHLALSRQPLATSPLLPMLSQQLLVINPLLLTPNQQLPGTRPQAHQPGPQPSPPRLKLPRRLKSQLQRPQPVCPTMATTVQTAPPAMAAWPVPSDDASP